MLGQRLNPRLNLTYFGHRLSLTYQVNLNRYELHTVVVVPCISLFVLFVFNILIFDRIREKVP